MLFWKGYGILGFLIPALVFIVLLLIGKFIFGIEDDFSMDKSFLFIYTLISSISIWKVGRKLNGRKPKLLIDPETNEEVLLKREHTLMFIKLEYWSFFFAVIGLGLILGIIE